MAKKIDEIQMGLSSHPVDELEVCIAVKLKMGKRIAASKFNDWPYLYIGNKGEPLFDLTDEPPFMAPAKAQKIIDKLDMEALQTAVDKHYAGLKIKVDNVFKTTELS